SVIQHAQRLSRDGRRKLKRKFFNDKPLKTEEEHLEDNPKEMTKNEWKFLVGYIGVMRRLRKKARKQVKVGLIKRCLTIMELKALLAVDRKFLYIAFFIFRFISCTCWMRLKNLKGQRDQGCAWQRHTWILASYGLERDQLIDGARKDAENARTEVEQAKKEVEAVRNNLDGKST
ncbi:Chaperone protein DnaK, partial [Bienertia sinuspersici]